MILMKIGVFDSGLGGIFVLEQLVKKYPNNHYVYFGDTKNIPYGDKTKKQVTEFSNKIIDFFNSLHVDLIIIACGTVSANVYPKLKNKDNIIDILSPTKEYLEQSNYQKVGVIGTKLMIKSHYFKKNLNKKVVELATPSLVLLIEKNEMDQTILDNYLKKLKDIDVLVLGCTHYKALTKYIRDLPLIELGSILTEKINLTNSKEGSITFYFSLVNEQIEKNVRKIFKDIDISEVTL